jgi:hypothetical protein
VRPCARCTRIHENWNETCEFYRDDPPININNEFQPAGPPSDPSHPSESSSDDQSDDPPD